MMKWSLKMILGLFIFSVVLTACKDKTEIVEEVRAIKTITVSELTTGQIRKFSGVIKATDSSRVSFEVSGKVTSVKVDIGDQVEKGQVLAVIDAEPYKLDVDAAEAEIVEARAKVLNKKEEYERQERVYRQGAGAKSKVERAKYNYDAAISGVNYQATRLNLAKRNLRNTELKSPYDGHIAWRSVEPHEEVKSGKELFEIDAKGEMELFLAVPETTIHRLYIGGPATVMFPTLPGESVKGKISYIGSAAIKANAFPVKVGLIDPPAKIKPGMTSEANLILKDEGKKAGFLVPINAILAGKEPRQGYTFVYDTKTSTVRKNLVRTRGAQYNMAIVSEGLSDGDIIAVAGVSFLTDGMKVKLMER
jgi:RND family efflux transporter MFP subunit